MRTMRQPTATTQTKGSNDRNAETVHAIAQTASALEPGAEIVRRKNAKGTAK